MARPLDPVAPGALLVVPLSARRPIATPALAALAVGLGLASVRCLTSAGLPAQAWRSVRGAGPPTIGPAQVLLSGSFDAGSRDDVTSLSFSISGPQAMASTSVDVVVAGRLEGMDLLCAEIGRRLGIPPDVARPSPLAAESTLNFVIEALFLALRLALAEPSTPSSDVLATADALADAITRSANLFAGERAADAVLDLGQWAQPHQAQRSRLADLAERFGALRRERTLAWRARAAAQAGDVDVATLLLRELEESHPVEARFELACLLFRSADFLGSSEAATRSLSSLKGTEGRFFDLAYSEDAQPAEASRSWREVAQCQLALSLLRSERYDDALVVARQAETSSTEPQHAARLVAHILRDRAIDGHGRDDPSWRSHLTLHLEALERVYGLDPDPQEVQAALEAADLLDDEEATRRWLTRLGTP